MHQFFCYDTNHQRVRPLLPIDSPPFPGLSKRLLRNVQQGRLHFHDILWNTILDPNPNPGPLCETPYFDGFRKYSRWHYLTPKYYREQQTELLCLFTLKTNLDSMIWINSWKLNMAPEARSLWYGVIYQKIPCQKARAAYDKDVSPLCSFCSADIEDRVHLLIECPVKLSVWTTALAYYFPFLSFSPTTLQDIVFSIQQVSLIDNDALFNLVARILRAIWRYHWLFTLEQVPFSQKVVLTKILE